MIRRILSALRRLFATTPKLRPSTYIAASLRRDRRGLTPEQVAQVDRLAAQARARRR